MVNSIGDIKPQLKVVLDHFHEIRDRTQAQIGELTTKLREQNQTIASLSRELYGSNAPLPVSVATHKYAKASVRWAILDLLANSTPLNTPEIAEILKSEGVTTKAANFTNNVSAVLSSTMKGVGEVRQTSDEKWELTEKGRNAIYHIRLTPKFRKSCPWATTAPNVSANGAVAAKGGEAL
jgi:hypothetical protein